MPTASVLYFEKYIGKLQCTKCGATTDAGCGCGASYEIAEEKATKREANRQAVNRYAAKKREQKQHGAHNVPSIEIAAENEIRTAETKLSTTRMQSLMFDSVCRLLAEMTPHTRSRVRRHMEENYGNDK